MSDSDRAKFQAIIARLHPDLRELLRRDRPAFIYDLPMDGTYIDLVYRLFDRCKRDPAAVEWLVALLKEDREGEDQIDELLRLFAPYPPVTHALDVRGWPRQPGDPITGQSYTMGWVRLPGDRISGVPVHFYCKAGNHILLPGELERSPAGDPKCPTDQQIMIPFYYYRCPQEPHTIEVYMVKIPANKMDRGPDTILCPQHQVALTIVEPGKEGT